MTFNIIYKYYTLKLNILPLVEKVATIELQGRHPASLYLFLPGQASQTRTYWNGHIKEWKHPGGGVLRFGLDRGLPLEPQNPYTSLRVILAENGTHY